MLQRQVQVTGSRMVRIDGLIRKPLIELPQYLESEGYYRFDAPPEVEGHLRGSKSHEFFEFEGFIWRRLRGGTGEVYSKAKYVPTESIMGVINPWLDILEDRVKENVTIEQILPPYESKDGKNFIIPATNFFMRFEEQPTSIYSLAEIVLRAAIAPGPLVKGGRAVLATEGTRIAMLYYTVMPSSQS